VPVFSKDNKKILFIHIPKAGGSTIENIFLKSGYAMEYHDHGKKKKNSLNSVRKCSPQHMHRDLINEIFIEESFDLIFTIIRNPINRFRSELAFRFKDSENIKEDQISKWVRRTLKKVYPRDNYIYDNHIRPQNEFIMKSSKVFKLEDGIENILMELNIKYDLNLNLNHIERKLDSSNFKIGNSTQIPLSEECMNLIFDFYKDDF